jgi:hypothetical protein
MMMMTSTPISIAASAYNYSTPKAKKETETQATEDRKLIGLLTNKENFALVDTNNDGVMDKWEVERFVKVFDKKTKDSGDFADLKGAFERIQNFQRDLTLAKMGDADKAKDKLEPFGISKSDIGKINNDFNYWDNTNATGNKGKGLDVLANWYAQQTLKDKSNSFATGENSYEGLTQWLNGKQEGLTAPEHNKVLKSSSSSSSSGKSKTDKTDDSNNTEKAKPEGFNWLNALLIGGLGFLGGRLTA